MIKIISPLDQINQVTNSLTEYFKNGAGGVPLKVVWLVYPNEKMVEVFTSRKDVKICTDADICSAAPVLDDFEISVDDIFKEKIQP